MSQVLYNLINNAINYTGDDRRVTVRQTVNGSMVKIEVEDTGDGIDENDIRLIWDRYYKIVVETKNKCVLKALDSRFL